ncbi:MAG: hypothetical protein ABW110_06595, partial [Steroidobacteraceae bacterium]
MRTHTFRRRYPAHSGRWFACDAREVAAASVTTYFDWESWWLGSSILTTHARVWGGEVMPRLISLNEVAGLAGQELGVSAW